MSDWLKLTAYVKAAPGPGPTYTDIVRGLHGAGFTAVDDLALTLTKTTAPPPSVHCHECVGDQGHMGWCCCDCATSWHDPEHGMGRGL